MVFNEILLFINGILYRALPLTQPAPPMAPARVPSPTPIGDETQVVGRLNSQDLSNISAVNAMQPAPPMAPAPRPAMVAPPRAPRSAPTGDEMRVQVVGHISSQDVSNIPMVKLTREILRSGRDCATCLEPFVRGERVARLNCHHIFHRQCIVPWLMRQNTCPMCRRRVDPKKWTTVRRRPDTSQTIVIE